MAPPRQRPTATVDDSRSETSSISKEPKTSAAPKVRKSAATSTAGATMTTKDMKVAAAAAAMASISTSVPNVDAGASAELPGIPWPQMPLSILHDYRHAYKLPTPSAYSKSYSRMLLSSGIGLRSPTAIAARRAQAKRQKNGSSTRGSQQDLPLGSEAMDRTMSRNTESSVGRAAFDSGLNNNTNNNGHAADLRHEHLHHIIGQGRISKDQLAMAVRKHFNSAGLMEQEAIARFLYKVREEGKGREFRLRFQP